MRSVLLAAAAVLMLVLRQPRRCVRRRRRPCLNDPLAAKVTGETWWDYNTDGVRDADERDRMWRLSVRPTTTATGIASAGEAMVDERQRRDVHAAGRHAQADDGRRPRRRAHQVPALRQRERRLHDRAASPRPRGACAGRRGAAPGRPTADVDFPRVGVAQLSGMIWDDKNENGRREAGEDGVAVPARVPRRRPRRRARSRVSRRRHTTNITRQVHHPDPDALSGRGRGAAAARAGAQRGRGLHGAGRVRGGRAAHADRAGRRPPTTASRGRW